MLPWARAPVSSPAARPHSPCRACSGGWWPAGRNQGWWRFGGGAEALARLLGEYACVAIPSADSGCQMSGWFRREIKSTACRKFRDEQFLWFRVAENTYDNCAFHSKMGERK